ncbi:MAG TPA: bifunctional D-glycero-beta-D-manno-heptose-7-phosphate kinase/D-glycero-beta-D-manno-heptose 1-phosphate adenylyltransferase HldE [Verrucomicrobiae bacterium]|nr:bifunctional D-glycero-beta-D-manno-heptose-7-phosphate kinase/D-glycero-beta-D-manno-heptose 1-phosphate adenylyltransferase HldE [Verrucomicrobiae bacterium]
MDRKSAESVFLRAPELRVFVIGDIMLDEYLFGRTERISPEAPVQVVEVTREEMRLGGAGNVVRGLRALGCCVSFCSVVGDDTGGRGVESLLAETGVSADGLYRDPSRPTSRKTRVISAHQQIVRIDRETRDPLPAAAEEALMRLAEREIPASSIVLVSDYGKGVLTGRVLAAVFAAAAAAGVPVVVDPKGTDYSRYRGAAVLTPNRRETEAASGISIRDEGSLAAAAARVMETTSLPALLVTRSEEGMSLFIRGDAALHLPTAAREVYDVTGAGDTVISVLACALAGGLPLPQAAALANVAAGVAVTKLGASTVSPQSILSALLPPDSAEAKIHSAEVIQRLAQEEREAGRRIVFTNGCFDLLHAGHVKYLQKARALGDLLILGLNSDASVRRLKGESRPLITQEERAHLLASLMCVDYVVIFEEDTPIELIRRVRPDILAKGADYTREGVVGHDLVSSYGGRVELVELVEGRSTTGIIEKIVACSRGRK